MRIVIATFHPNLIGGTEKYVQVILPALVERGHEVALLYERPAASTQERIDSHCAPLTSWCVEELGIEAVRQRLEHWKPDVVYSQGLRNGGVEDMLLDSQPVVLFAHEYYGTCGTGSKCHSFPRIQPCQRRFGPACLILHYPRHCGALDPREAWETFRRQAGRHSRLPRYRSMLVASAHMRDEFLRHGLPREQVHLAPLPGDKLSGDLAPREPRSSPARILMISRLTPIKGGHHLIPAVIRASQALGRPLELTIAGDGPQLAALKQMAQRSGLPVEFTGWVDRQRKLDLLAGADLLAVPSLWPEPFGLVGLEAGAAGVPAVGYRVGGIPDWLIDGQTGELAPGDPPNIDGLAQAIGRALGNDAHYRQLCQGARLSSRKFNVAAHLEILEDVLIQARGASPQPMQSVHA